MKPKLEYHPCGAIKDYSKQIEEIILRHTGEHRLNNREEIGLSVFGYTFESIKNVQQKTGNLKIN